MGQDLQLSVAIAQCASVVGDVQDNLRRAELLCQDARKQRAELILFPECHATGYSYRDLPWLVRRCAEPVDGPIAQRLMLGQICGLSGFVEGQPRQIAQIWPSI